MSALEAADDDAVATVQRILGAEVVDDTTDAERQLLADARFALRAGMRLWPAGRQKKPVGKWGGAHQGDRADWAQIQTWAAQPGTRGWVALCGGGEGYFCLDVEAAGMEHPEIRRIVEQAPEHAKRASYSSGGQHVWIRLTDADEGSMLTQPLAYRDTGADVPDEKRWQLLAEIRGASPEKAGTRASGAYAVLTGPGRPPLRDDFAPWELSRADVDALLAPIRAVDEKPKREPTPQKPRSATATVAGGSTADVLFEAVRGGLLDVLAVLPDGWEIAGTASGGKTFIRRPGAESEQSGNVLDGVFVMHSSSVTWAEPGRGYSPAEVLAASRHSGDIAAALRAVEDAAEGDLDSPYAGWPRAVLDAVAASREKFRRSRELAEVDLGGGSDVNLDGAEAPAVPRRRIELTPASAISPKPVRWLWEQRISCGGLSLIAGPEGLGKSTLGYWIAAQVTKGLLPGDVYGQQRAVIVCATEDSWAHTIVPRLIAADADLDRVYRLEVITSNDTHGSLTLPKDNSQLEDAIAQTDTAFVLLDPIMSRMGGDIDTHKDSDTRSALEPLGAICVKTGAAMVGLIHFNKSGSSDPLANVMASKAFTSVARSVSFVVRDADDETGARRIFATPKNNLGRTDGPLLPFTIRGFDIDTDEGVASTGQLVWGGQIEGQITDHLGQPADPESRSLEAEAREWLNDYMFTQGGRAFAADVYKAAAAAGVIRSGNDESGERRLRRAKTALKIRTDSTKGFQPTKIWVGPADALPAESGEEK